MQPALQVNRRFRLVAGHGIILAWRRGSDIPAITGCLCLVDHEGRDSAPARRFFEFVGPATIICHPTSTEEAADGMVFRHAKIWIIDQEQRDLPLQVYIAEIIPVPLRRADAKTHEHDRRIFNPDHTARIGRADLDIAALRHFDRTAIRVYIQCTNIRDDRMLHRHNIRPRTITSAGLKAEFCVTRDQVINRLRFPLGSRRDP